MTGNADNRKETKAEGDAAASQQTAQELQNNRKSARTATEPTAASSEGTKRRRYTEEVEAEPGEMEKANQDHAQTRQ